MGTTLSYTRLPWEDAFKEPTIAALRKPLPAPSAKLFDSARKQLLAIDGIREEFEWYGEGWRWAVSYRRNGDGSPFAVLIPNPEDLQLAVPLDRAFLGSLRLKDLKRTVRDGLELASAPFHTNWGIWSLQSSGLLTDLRKIISRKRDFNGA